MSGRARSPLSPGRGRKPPQPASSPINRDHVSGQMQDIFSVVKKLRVTHTLLLTSMNPRASLSIAPLCIAGREGVTGNGTLNDVSAH